MKNRIAYLASWFPALTETFVLNEVLELCRQGADVEVYPLFGARSSVAHPGSSEAARRTRYASLLSGEAVAAQLYWLFRRPAAYLRALARTVVSHRRSPGALIRSLVVFPRAAMIARRLQEGACAHVHAHWATYPTLAAFIIGRLTGIGYSFTAHAHDLYVDRAMLKEKIEAARFVVTISEFNRRLLRGIYGERASARTQVVHCGVDVERFQPRPRPSNPIFTFVCVAGFREYKGHRFLLDACGRLLKGGLSFRCILIGAGEEEARIRAQIAELGLGSSVEILGAQPHDRVLSILQSVDAAVLPSVVTSTGMMEGIPVFLMEALACGLPAVATDISGVRELIVPEETGLLVPPGNSGALAEALRRLHGSHELRERLGSAGRAHVLDRFDAGKNVSRLRRMFEEAIGAATERDADEPPEPDARRVAGLSF